MKAALGVIALLLAFAGAGYFLYMQLPTVPITLQVMPQDDNLSVPHQYSASKQFYPNMRFATHAITYGFEEACSDKKRASVREAVFILESESALDFIEQPVRDAQVDVLCSEIWPEPKQTGHFIAGEGGPTEIINTTLYSVIREGKISLYRDENCDRPLIALHEILHVLGFDHNSNPHSILYPILDCAQELDRYIVESINALYEEESLPDLVIMNANATKERRYVSFSIEIVNRGLVESGNAKLDVLEGDRVLRTFDLGNLDIGVRKTLSVQNLKASRSGSEIRFRVVSSSRELDENNNYLALSAAEERNYG
ncbi:MAG TPA: matrixin family metalloprotease [Candidatus Nanoarchaeia archaeon]|nr:matrixin family metalloprotease [Candidatus Nanoarchaeia archaeon]